LSLLLSKLLQLGLALIPHRVHLVFWVALRGSSTPAID